MTQPAPARFRVPGRVEFFKRPLFGNRARMARDGEMFAFCHVCGECPEVCPMIKELQELVCEKCWETAKTWCFSCGAPESTCCQSPGG